MTPTTPRTMIDRARRTGEEVVDVAREEARHGAGRAEEVAERATHVAESARTEARHGLKDAGYAALGLGDAAVRSARSLGSDGVSAAAGRLASDMRDTYESLAERGRSVAGRTKRDPRVREARRQTEAAATQAKGAATRVQTESARASREARETTATATGRGRRAASETREAAKGAASQVKGAATSAGKAARAQGEAVQAAADKAGSPDVGTGALEDRTVEQLRNRAAELDIDGRSGMKKQELVEAIRSAQ